MKLELATVSALGQTIAIFVVLLAIVFMLKKSVWRWGAVIVGLLGRHDYSPRFDIHMACFITNRCSLLRCVHRNVAEFDKNVSSALVFILSFASAFGALILAVEPQHFPNTYFIDVLIILSMSFFGGFGVVLLMYAFRNAPSSVLAPFSYFGLINAFC